MGSPHHMRVAIIVRLSWVVARMGYTGPQTIEDYLQGIGFALD